MILYMMLPNSMHRQLGDSEPVGNAGRIGLCPLPAGRATLVREF